MIYLISCTHFHFLCGVLGLPHWCLGGGLFTALCIGPSPTILGAGSDLGSAECKARAFPIPHLSLFLHPLFTDCVPSLTKIEDHRLIHKAREARVSPNSDLAVNYFPFSIHPIATHKTLLNSSFEQRILLKEY